jgi:hypothetical protein
MMQTKMERDHKAALRSIFVGIDRLKQVHAGAFANPDAKFTIDGRLVGDIGEAIAHFDYGVALHKSQKKGTDGTLGKKEVQVKATFQDKLTFTRMPDPEIQVLCLQLFRDGRHALVYKGSSDRLRREFWPDGADKQRRLDVSALRRVWKHRGY